MQEPVRINSRTNLYNKNMRFKSFVRDSLDATLGRYLGYLFNDKISGLMFAIGGVAINSSTAARPEFRYLWDAEVKVFSQNGEDGILNYICDVLDIGKPSAIEIGAGNFQECNTRYLAEHRSANVLAVDSNPELRTTIGLLPVNIKTNIQFENCWVTTRNINQIIEKAKNTFGQIDILSIDIDGNDYWVLKEANLSGIKVIVIEFNPLLSRMMPVSVPKNDEFDRTTAHFSWLYYGASLPAFIFLLGTRGFSFIGTTRHGSNAFFVAEEFEDKFALSFKELALHTDVRARESRGKTGELTFVSGQNRVKLIEEMHVINVLNGEILQILECWKDNGSIESQV